MKDHNWILPEYKEGKIEAYMSNQIPMFQPPSEWLPPENIPNLDDICRAPADRKSTRLNSSH